MRIIGHRGAAAVAAENTVPSVLRAFADGADAVEVDVRRTADGVLVVIHDETLLRTAGIDARIAEMDAAAIRAATAGEAPVPTLAEIWEAAAGRIVLEIKGRWGSGEAAATAVTLAEFLAHRPHAGAVVSSFDPTALEAFRSAGGRAATGVLTTAAIDPASNLQLAIDAGHQVCYLPGPAIEAAVIAQAHAAGKSVVAWTVNDAAAIRALAGNGCDGVITDDPAAARAALVSG